MTVNEAEAIRDNLLEGLDTDDDLVLDLNKECDTAGIQLLLSARMTPEKKCKGFSVTGASLSLMDTIARIGLDPDAVLNPKGMKPE